MEAMEAARFNIYWYLSLLTPLLVMAVATYRRKKSIMWSGAAASLVATYLLCNLAVQAKWETRWRIAQTEEEQRYATADGANLVFTAFIIGPFEAILYTSIWGVVGWRAGGRIARMRSTPDVI